MTHRITLEITKSQISTGIFCTFFLAHAITQKRRMSVRNSTGGREFAPDDSLLASPTAPSATLPKY